MKTNKFILPLLCLLAVACREVPSYDVVSDKESDLKENMINANRLIAKSEAQQIDSYITRRGWQMEHVGDGVRVMVTARGDGRRLQREDTVVVTYSVEALNGIALYDGCRDTLVVGHLQPNRGVDAVVRTLSAGAEAVAILPSEQAFGVVGDGDRIGNRMILIYKLKIEKTIPSKT